jgi:signal transduction histidine kinase
VRLRELSIALLEAEDRERRRISRDLHDRVSANLSAMQLTLSGLAGRLDPSAEAALGPLLSDLRELVLSTSAEIRNVIADLRPPALDDFGLAPALRSYARAAAARMQVKLDFEADADLPRLAPTVETAFFRIAQEALTNIAKHAHARHVRIALSAPADRLELRIEDDGGGFNEGASRSAGNGLRNMRERADAVRASFGIASAPGAGTRLTVSAPLRPGAA